MLLPMSRITWWHGVAALLLFVIAFCPTAQIVNAQESRGGLPSIDFIALGADGQPVRDLTAGEVVVKIDGRPRAIRALEYRHLADPRGEFTSAGGALPSPYGTNASPAGGRKIVLAIDDDSVLPGREGPMREAVAGLLDRLRPQDEVALVTMPYGGVKVPLTTDRTRVLLSMSRTTGQASRSETGSEMACRTRRILETLTGFLESFGVAEGPTTVLFFTVGLAGPRRDAPLTLAPGMCELTVDMFGRVGTAAGAARAHFFIVQPDDIQYRPGLRTENIAGSGFAGSDNPLEGIEHLAGVTAAQRVTVTGLNRGALERVARETSGYYVATLEPERTDRNERTHLLDVKVSRPNVTVRARPEITFSRTVSMISTARPTSVREMLAVTDPFTEVPMRAAAFVTQGEDGKLKIVTVAEPANAEATLKAVIVGLVDQADTVVAQWSAPDAADRPLVAAMLAPPGNYRLRVAALDTQGRAGAADYNFTAELTKAGPLSLSSLVLGLSRGGGFVPRLEFGTEPVALASFEIYGGAEGTRATARLELARTTDGPAIITSPLALEATRVPGRYTATGAIAIGALPPGDYVARAVIAPEGAQEGRVYRTLRKRAR
jgi:hypothetical protein